MSGTEDKRLQKALKKQGAGKIDEAIELYLRILRSDPGNHLINMILGLIYTEQRVNVGKAEAHIKKAMSINPDMPLLQIAMGNLQRLRGQPDIAIQHYHRAIELAPHMPNPYYHIGNILLQKNQDMERAEEHLLRAIAIAPEMADAHYALANVLLQLGKHSEAIEQFYKAMEHDSAYDKESTHFMIAGLKGDTIASPPREYVENVFDNYAGNFEQHVTEKLGYTVPGILREFVSSDTVFKNVADLGCGTGLCGKAFRNVAEHLAGIDISPRMIEQTGINKIYDELFAADLNEFLENTTSLFDLFIAADVFIYVGALDRLFDNVRKKAENGACFLFSIETCDGDDFKLLSTLRYAHSTAYIKKLAKEHGFTISDSKPVNIRKHHDAWLKGEAFKLVVVK